MASPRSSTEVVMRVRLRLTGHQYLKLRTHLLHSDRLEAAAIMLCGRRDTQDSPAFTVRHVALVLHEVCSRSTDRVVWPTDVARPLIEAASKENLAVVKVHSHPLGCRRFSLT